MIELPFGLREYVFRLANKSTTPNELTANKANPVSCKFGFPCISTKDKLDEATTSLMTKSSLQDGINVNV